MKLLRSHIHEYGHVRNRHVMFINDRTYKEHRNLNIRKHVTTSCSGTKPFYQPWVKGFDVRRRDTIFYAVLFIWPPTQVAPIGRTFASRLRAPTSILLVWRLKPDSYFLQILTQTSACFRCVTSPAPCHPVSSRTVMTSEWHLHPLARTRVNTCFNLTPKQPMCWAERFSAKTKLKGMNRNPSAIS